LIALVFGILTQKLPDARAISAFRLRECTSNLSKTTRTTLGLNSPPASWWSGRHQLGTLALAKAI
jgi:hypothetical protein